MCSAGCGEENGQVHRDIGFGKLFSLGPGHVAIFLNNVLLETKCANFPLLLLGRNTPGSWCPVVTTRHLSTLFTASLPSPRAHISLLCGWNHCGNQPEKRLLGKMSCSHIHSSLRINSGLSTDLTPNSALLSIQPWVPPALHSLWSHCDPQQLHSCLLTPACCPFKITNGTWLMSELLTILSGGITMCPTSCHWTLCISLFFPCRESFRFLSVWVPRSGRLSCPTPWFLYVGSGLSFSKEGIMDPHVSLLLPLKPATQWSIE